ETPPLPPAHAPTSSAALAASTAHAGAEDGSSGARLGEPTTSSSQGRLVPVSGARAAPQPATTPGPPAYTYEQLQVMLAARGVTMQHLQTVGDRGVWKFSCAVPNRREPGTRRVYEGSAAGGHGLAAMKTV